MANSIANVSNTLKIINIVLLSKLMDSRCLVPHFMAVLMGLLNTSFALTEPKSKVPSPVAVFSNNPKAISMGNNISTANTLKKSWTVAAANARLNSLPLLI